MSGDKNRRAMSRSDLTVLAVNPFEYLGRSFAELALQAGAFPIVKVNPREEEVTEKLDALTETLNGNFGLLVENDEEITFGLPSKAEYLITHPRTKANKISSAQRIYLVTSLEEARMAEKEQAAGIIIKGNEAAGEVGEETSFILFQKIIRTVSLPVWIQGGVGLHSAAALVATGAKGIVLDYQMALFPELRLPLALRDRVKHLDGTETTVVKGHRIHVKPSSQIATESITLDDLDICRAAPSADMDIMYMSQDIGRADYFYSKFKTLENFVQGIKNSITGHIRQAKYYEPLKTNNLLCQDLGIQYPYVQGPMTRVSDKASFADAIASGGALPFLALSLMKGQKARDLLQQTSEVMKGKSWGVGILGFAPQALREEQYALIEECMPDVVLIAGGRPSQAKRFEEKGIKVFLHVPSGGLLDMFLKDGASRFVFEGRECGGHVGPLASLVLWEKQIERLLEEEEPERLSVLFAGGIQDDLSAAIISAMAAPLTARGVKVGVLMGSAYLYTKEAVTTGAILQEFQDKILAQHETVLVETGPGHVTRCLNTPFVDFFEKEKQRLKEQNEDREKIWLTLEQLNVGRLRVAAKGIERKGDQLIQVGQAEQEASGMYMIGQVAGMQKKLTTIDDLHQDMADGCHHIVQSFEPPEFIAQPGKSLDIAIIGMASIFSEADNVEEYWQNVVSGKYCISEVPDERWNKEIYYDPNSTNGEKTPSKWGGFIPKMKFDPTEFGIAPQSLHSIDPAQLLSLKVAREAIEDAGYRDKSFDKENTSVVFGVDANGSDLASNYNFRNNYPQLYGSIPEEVDEQLPKMTEDSFPGVLTNVVAGRIANRLDLGGRNLTVDAACASSLAALDTACQELATKRSNMVLAGGVDLHNNIGDYLMFSSTKALSKKDNYQTFDAASDGIILGEGVAVVVLKRLEDAKRDGDRVYAVIKGIGASSDGKSLGLTAPRKKGQLTAFSRAYQQAGVLPADVGLIEAHGTGTVVGDRTELSSMTDFFSSHGAVRNQTTISSVKPQIGHTKCVSGMAGLIKASLSVYHGVLPPLVNLTQPNKYYDAVRSPFVFNDTANLWSKDRRVAGVSAFGFGGTNYHAVIENEAIPAQGHPTLKAWPSELIVFRGDDLNEAKKDMRKVIHLLEVDADLKLKDIAYTLARGTKKVQLSIIADSAEDLLNKINVALSGSQLPGMYSTFEVPGKVAFLFSGQGSQRINMARDLFVNFPLMREQLRHYPELIDIVFPPATFDDQLKKEQQVKIKDTRNAQPLLGVVDYAIASFLRSLGVTPDMVAGHSYGEIPALCFANVFDPKYLVDISKERAMAIMDAIEGDPGAMIAVNCPEDELIELLMDHDDVYLANHNSSRQLVVSGSTMAIDTLSAKLSALKISCRKLPVACAFHSPILANAQSNFQKALEAYAFNSPEIQVWSNTTAQPYPEQASEIKERLAEHLVRPVLFNAQMKKMCEDNARIFVEVGPGNVLTNLIDDIIRDDHVRLSTEHKNKHGISFILHTLARYMASGREIDVLKLFEGRAPQLIDFNKPDKYSPRKTTWLVNGHTAYPYNTQEPSIKMIEQKPHVADQAEQQPKQTVGQNPVLDQMVQEYLANVRTVIQSQHEILMSYLGQVNAGGRPQMSAPLNTAIPATPPVAPPVAQPTNTPSQPVTLAKTDQQPLINEALVRDTLLTIVSEKTGYPVDMLGMDMDLESDLSIDSIKRVEIIGKLKEKFGSLGNSPGNEDEILEQLTSIKTLTGLVTWIMDHAESTPSSAIVASQPNVLPQAPVNQGQFSAENIKETLLNIVSEKTGYPIDMLGMDMDLEADLSIDSIKRVEIVGKLKEKYDVVQAAGVSEDEALESLTAIKTLNGLVDWISTSTNAMAAEPKTSDSTHLPEPHAPKHSASDIKATLLQVVSEKTGYPEEMLGMDMDLEADLSIDSIKRVEIIGKMKTALPALDKMADADDAVLEQLATIKTLNGLVDWLSGAMNTTKAPDFKDQVNKKKTSVLTDGEKEILRLGFEFVTADIKRSPIKTTTGKKFAITAMGGDVAKDFKAMLAQHNIVADLVSINDDLSAYDGLLFLDLSTMDYQPTINDLCAFTKSLDSKKAEWVYVITDYKSELLEAQGAGRLDRIQGYSGFINSLHKEWPAQCRKINVELGASLAYIASITNDELYCDDEGLDIYYKSGQRYTIVLKDLDLATRQSTLSLDKEDVVLVFGGAQGITSEVVIQMSSEFPCHYVLVGRTGFDALSVDDAYAGMMGLAEIKQKLLQAEKFNSPKELEKRASDIYKRNQIHDTITKIESHGGKVTYKSIDLRDTVAVTKLLEGLYADYGRIDGVIHAAGYLADKYFIDKSAENFEQVYTTKVNPLKTLMAHLREDTKFLMLFSTISSVMGNKGQVDYAAANSVLDDYAHEVEKKLKIRTTAINWGPWQGKGMMSEALEKDFLKRGVTSIPLDVGVKAFMDELKYGNENQVILMTPLV